MPSYDDSRYSYEQAGLAYEGLLVTAPQTGAQPAGSGMLASLRLVVRSLTGAQPSGTATVAKRLLAPRTTTGAQPAASGTLVRLYAPQRALAGDQDPAAGQLAVRGAFKRTRSGAQPTASGLLARLLLARRALSGAQPAGSASLASHAVIPRRLEGIQPVSGTTYEQTDTTYEQAGIVYENTPARLTYRGILARVLTGHQPGGHGGVGHDHAVDAGLFVYIPHESSPTVVYLGATDPDSDVLAPREDADELVYSAREERMPGSKTTYRTRERTTASTYRPG